MATHNLRSLVSWKKYLAISLLLATAVGCNSQSSSQVLQNLKKINQSQQEYRLANSYFASSVGDLNISLDKQTPYRYTIRIIDKTLVMHVAQPTRSQLPSYIALIHVRESQNSVSTITCKTDTQITDIAISSQLYPAVARQRSQNSPLQCPPDFTQL